MKKLLSIGNLAKAIGVEVHTVRFWTEEFEEFIKYELGKGDRRYYDESAIKTFLKIKKLIHEDGIKIKSIKEKKLLLVSPTKEMLTEIKNILHEVKAELMLSSK